MTLSEFNEENPWGNTNFSFPQLLSTKKCDVVIIGAGLTGILCAYWLSKKGKNVIVLESEKVLTGATAYTTAFVTAVLDTDISDLIKAMGREKTKMLWESASKAIDFFEAIISNEKINCDFVRCTSYMYSNTEKESDDLTKEFQAMAKIGIDCRYKRLSYLSFLHDSYIEIYNQAKLHPVKFLQPLVVAAQNYNTIFFEKSKVESITSSLSNFCVQTEHGKIYADYVVTATYKPFNNPNQLLFKTGKYISYIITFKLPYKIPDGIYEDMQLPYHYFRIDNNSKACSVMLGGEDHRAEIPISPQKSYNSLKHYAEKIFGTEISIEKKWSGSILEPTDGIALIGPYKKSELVATGFSGNGFIYSAIAAQMFDDYISGRKNDYSNLYDPKRIPSFKNLAVKGRDYSKEFWNGVIKKLF